MTREEAIKKLMGYSHTPEERAALEVLIPELRESEDERIVDGFRTLLNGIRRDGGLTLNKVPLDKCFAWLEKQKEFLHISKTCKENPDSFTDEDERIRKEMISFLRSPFIKESLTDEKVAPWLDWLEKQKESLRDFIDNFPYSDEQKEQKPLSTEETELNSLAFLSQMGYTCIPPKKEHQNNSDAPKKALGGALNSPLDKDKNLDDIAQDYVEAVKKYNPELTWNLMQTAVCYGYQYREQEEHSMSAEEVLARAGLKPYKDGNKWCILAGDNIQEGICGFGDTIDEALYEFLKEVIDLQKEPHYTKRNALFDKCVENCDPEVMQRVSDEVDEMLGKEQKPEESTLTDFEQGLYTAISIFVGEYERDKEANLIEFVKEWSSDLLEPAKEQKPAEWSEEDERMRNQLIYDVEYHKKKGLISAKQNKATEALYNGIEKCYDEKIAWLKSLRPQPHWKPSEHQMTILKAVKEYVGRGSGYWGEALGSLIEDLEKL